MQISMSQLLSNYSISQKENSNYANFARTKGSKDKKKRRNKMLRNVGMGAAALAAIGGGAYLQRKNIGKFANRFRKNNKTESIPILKGSSKGTQSESYFDQQLKTKNKNINDNFAKPLEKKGNSLNEKGNYYYDWLQRKSLQKVKGENLKNLKTKSYEPYSQIKQELRNNPPQSSQLTLAPASGKARRRKRT